MSGSTPPDADGVTSPDVDGATSPDTDGVTRLDVDGTTRPGVDAAFRSGRAQTDPIAALVAVAAVCFALVTYTGAVADAVPAASDRDPSEPTLERVWAGVGSDGVVEPTDVYAVDDDVPPDGYGVAVVLKVDGDEHVLTIAVDGDRRRTIREIPTETRSESRPVGVLAEHGALRAGTLRVEVWS